MSATVSYGASQPAARRGYEQCLLILALAESLIKSTSATWIDVDAMSISLGERELIEGQGSELDYM
jgi:hypothetical protein